jgi:hypothetical protein
LDFLRSSSVLWSDAAPAQLSAPNPANAALARLEGFGDVRGEPGAAAAATIPLLVYDPASRQVRLFWTQEQAPHFLIPALRIGSGKDSLLCFSDDGGVKIAASPSFSGEELASQTEPSTACSTFAIIVHLAVAHQHLDALLDVPFAAPRTIFGSVSLNFGRRPLHAFEQRPGPLKALGDFVQVGVARR